MKVNDRAKINIYKRNEPKHTLSGPNDKDPRQIINNPMIESINYMKS